MNQLLEKLFEKQTLQVENNKSFTSAFLISLNGSTNSFDKGSECIELENNDKPLPLYFLLRFSEKLMIIFCES